MNATDPAAELAWTGERLVTTCHRPLVFEHVHRYAVACALAEGKRVLDIACGEGYGANLLARTASKVVGVDVDPTTIEHARRKYRDRNLEFSVGDCLEIPCADQSIDLVASFETIEHIADHERFLSEIKRVLAPGGLAMISSPDKAAYRAFPAGGIPSTRPSLRTMNSSGCWRVNSSIA
jgi:ubiquinone/menaquinone biosynthesis C-methylase UbiE